MATASAKGRGVPYVAAAGLGLALWAWAMARLVRGGCGDESMPVVEPLVVEVNSADEADLQTLPGVGEFYARRIVADGAANGPFRGPEDLLRVRGVTRELVEGIAPFVEFGDAGGTGGPGGPGTREEEEARP